MELPGRIAIREFDESFRLTPALWLEAIRELSLEHGLGDFALRPFADGSNLIASVSDKAIIKIFPPFHRGQWESEHRVLRHLQAHSLPVPVPRLLACGERSDGWPYVILSILPGVTLETIWPELTLAEKSRVLFQIGELMARVHAIPVGELRELEPEWTGFLSRQAENASARHRRLQMPSWFLDEVEEFISENLSRVPTTFEPVLLTGEYTPFNLLSQDRGLSGMIDFGDAMVGFRDYDLLGPSLFLGEGKAELIQSLYKGYGVTEVDTKRLMLLQILHRFSWFDGQLKQIPGWRERARNIEDLRRLIWPDGSNC